MKKWMIRTVGAGLLSLGFLAAGAGAAQADTGDWVSAGNSGILNGNQIAIPIQIPINIVGNGIGILGIGTGSGVGWAIANM